MVWRFLQKLAFWCVVATLGLGAILAGLSLRQYCWRQTEEIRATPDINNAFRQGTQTLREGYLNAYDLRFVREKHSGNFDLDYAPARLLIATEWTRWVRTRVDGLPKNWQSIHDWPQDFYEQARELKRQDELCRPLLLFNSAMEIAASVAMFVLVRHWTLYRRSPAAAAFLGLISALFFWFNPALIWDSHCWPQWDCWLLPFFLWAFVAASMEFWFIAGFLVALGVMFKAQILLVSPILLLWPLWRGQFSAIARCVIGFITGIAACAAVWLVRSNSAPNYIAICWLASATAAVAVLYPLSGQNCTRLKTLVLLCISLSLAIWPLFSLGLLWITGAIVALGLFAVAVCFLPRRAFAFAAAAWMSAALFLCVPIFGGSVAWYKVGIVSGSHQSLEMIAGPDCNLAAILQRHWNWGSLDPVVTLDAGGVANHVGSFLANVDRRFTFTPNRPLPLPLGYVLFAVYAASLVMCSFGAATHARNRSPRFLVAIATPWIVMFTVLPQMHERYLVWGAALSAMTIVISPGLALLSLFVSLIALMQQANLMARGQYSGDSIVKFMNGATPDVGWALMLAAAVFLYFAIKPNTSPISKTKGDI